MKKLAQLGLLLALVLGFSSPADAALLVEPLVGYNVSSKLDFEKGDLYTDGKLFTGGTGGAFGGRLGYQQLGFQVGLDYLHSTIDMDDDDFDKDIEMNEWAGFVGFEFPIFFRVYAGYIFSATGKTEMSDVKTDFSKGSGTKLGVGFTGLPFLSLNLEYRSGSFGEYEQDDNTVEDSTKYSSYLLSVSLPLTF